MALGSDLGETAGATVHGGFRRRTKFSSDETSMYRLSAERRGQRALPGQGTHAVCPLASEARRRQAARVKLSPFAFFHFALRFLLIDHIDRLPGEEGVDVGHGHAQETGAGGLGSPSVVRCNQAVLRQQQWVRRGWRFD